MLYFVFEYHVLRILFIWILLHVCMILLSIDTVLLLKM